MEARNNCEIIVKNITVSEEFIDISTIQDEYEIMLGEFIDLDIDIVTNSNSYTIEWIDPTGDSNFSCSDCENPRVRPLFNQTYIAVVTTLAGCVDQIEIRVRVNKERDVYSPNVFSPNGDGNNDVFFLTGTEFVMVNEFNIYDRWGNLVYSTTSKRLGEANEGWRGNYNSSPVNPGVYVWYAEVEWLDGFVKNIAGDVTVVR